MHRSLATSCWDRETTLVALTRNPDRYVRLAQALIDAVPRTWDRIAAHLVMASSGLERCEVAATCGATEQAEASCRPAVRRAIAELGTGALIPERALWIGIWIDYDIDAGRLSATIIHGGQIPLPPRSRVELAVFAHQDPDHPLLRSPIS